MAFSNESTLRIREHVRLAAEKLSNGENSFEIAKTFVWTHLREELGKSYGDCDDSDLPHVLTIINLLIGEKDEFQKW
jgi:hypothetical protein